MEAYHIYEYPCTYLEVTVTRPARPTNAYTVYAQYLTGVTTKFKLGTTQTEQEDPH